jgi:hypothetical protein
MSLSTANTRRKGGFNGPKVPFDEKDDELAFRLIALLRSNGDTRRLGGMGIWDTIYVRPVHGVF